MVNKIPQENTSIDLDLLKNIENVCPAEFVYICTGLACMIATLGILGHLCHYNEPTMQKYIIRILFMIPVYSLATFGIMLDTANSKFLYSAVRDFYEGYVLYIFFKLLVMYLGGYNQLSITLEFKVSNIHLSSLFLLILSRDASASHGPSIK